MNQSESNIQLPLQAQRPPLRVDAGNVIRIGTSRISLDVIIEQYENGMTPEALIRAYDSLELADVYSVISYYLRHRDEVLAYLNLRKEEAEALRTNVEDDRPRISRKELLARRAAGEQNHAPVGQ